MRVRDAELNFRFIATVRDALLGSRLLRLTGVTVVALGAANCSQKVGGIDPKYGVAPSPRVVQDGEPVPKGGGRQMVGKPYMVAGRTYVPAENPRYASVGLASWYGSNFHGRMTANGEIFDRYAIAAAHTTMPLPSYARVTNLQNDHSIIVRVNDRGPYHGNRIIDVSQRTAEALDFKRNGTARVRVEYVGRASPNGSDDRILLASLRTDGQPASLTGQPATLIARADTRPDAARTAIAIRTYEPDESEGEGAAEAPLPFARGGRPGGGRSSAASRASLRSRHDPERRDARSAVVPARPVLPPSRPVVASLTTAPFPAQTGFRTGVSLEPLDRSKFVGRSAQN